MWSPGDMIKAPPFGSQFGGISLRETPVVLRSYPTPGHLLGASRGQCVFLCMFVVAECVLCSPAGLHFSQPPRPVSHVCLLGPEWGFFFPLETPQAESWKSEMETPTHTHIPYCSAQFNHRSLWSALPTCHQSVHLPSFGGQGDQPTKVGGGV